MDARAVLKELAHRPLDAARHMRPRLTPELANAHPGGHENSIAWLMWHSGRAIDAQVSLMSGIEDVWTSQGFHQRSGLDLEAWEHGYQHTPEQARKVVITDVDLLFDYLQAAIDAQTAYIDTLSEDDLDVVIDRHYDPPTTRGVRLVSMSDDALQHVGQAAHALGMATSKGA